MLPFCRKLAVCFMTNRRNDSTSSASDIPHAIAKLYLSFQVGFGLTRYRHQRYVRTGTVGPRLKFLFLAASKGSRLGCTQR
jgi:hypothetical protein